jgi:hypothetical protein
MVGQYIFELNGRVAGMVGKIGYKQDSYSRCEGMVDKMVVAHVC